MSQLIYRAEVGSHAYGTSNEASDHDFVEIYVEDPEYITGLSKWKTEFQSSEGRTQAGGQDTTVYGFRKWAELVAQGNPNMIETLYIGNTITTRNERAGSGNNPTYLPTNHQWDLVHANRYGFLSKQAGHRFLGYANSQRMALAGVRNKRTNRPELVHTHGYDTKYAGHLIRVLVEGIELMRYGQLSFPLAQPDRDYIKNIRAGLIAKEDMFEVANDLVSDLEQAIERTDLPNKPDFKTLNRLMDDVYHMTWVD